MNKKKTKASDSLCFEKINEKYFFYEIYEKIYKMLDVIYMHIYNGLRLEQINLLQRRNIKMKKVLTSLCAIAMCGVMLFTNPLDAKAKKIFYQDHSYSSLTWKASLTWDAETPKSITNDCAKLYNNVSAVVLSYSNLSGTRLQESVTKSKKKDKVEATASKGAWSAKGRHYILQNNNVVETYWGNLKPVYFTY